MNRAEYPASNARSVRQISAAHYAFGHSLPIMCLTICSIVDDGTSRLHRRNLGLETRSKSSCHTSTEQDGRARTDSMTFCAPS